jgi:hypothetical protein
MFSKAQPIFVISAPRSGTTWLSKMLNAHPKVYCTENRLFGNYADLIQDDGSTEPRLRVTLDKYVRSVTLHANYDDLNLDSNDFQKELIREMIHSLWKFYRKRSRNKVLVDKITPYVDTSFRVAKQIQTYFPKAKIIYLLRDGRDVCTSGVFHWLKKRPAKQAYSEFELLRRQFFLDSEVASPSLNRFFTDSEIEEWAKTWSQPIRAFQTPGQSNLLAIRYEDMLSSSAQVLHQVFEFMKVARDKRIIESCLKAGDFKAMSGGRQQGNAKAGAHIRKGACGDWKNYFTVQDGQLFNEIAGQQLFHLNYEGDEQWFRCLPDSLNMVKT